MAEEIASLYATIGADDTSLVSVIDESIGKMEEFGAASGDISQASAEYWNEFDASVDQLNATLGETPTAMGQAGTAAEGTGAAVEQVGEHGHEAAGGLEAANQGAEMLSGGLGGLARAAGVAGLVELGAKAVEAGIELGKIGEESLQNETRLRAFAGGAVAAEQYMDGMSASVGNFMTKDEQAAMAAKALQLGLADTGEEAGRLAEMAIYLGNAQQSAAERVDGLTRVLITGRAQGLIQYGFNVQELQPQIEAVAKAHTDWTAKQVLANVVLSEGADRVQKLKDANYQAVPASQQVTKSVSDLKDVLGSQLVPGFTVAATATNAFVNGLTRMAASGDLLNTLIPGLGTATEATNRYLAAHPALAAALGISDGKQKDLSTSVHAAGSEFDYAERMANAYAASLSGTDEAATAAAAAAERYRVASADAETKRIIDRYRTQGDLANDASRYELGLINEEKDAQKRAQEEAWQQYQQEAQRATQAAEGEIKGMLSKGSQFSVNLGNMGAAGGPLAPGANGPFEALYRIQDIAKNNTPKWAEMYGLTQEDAKEITRKFQAGLYDPTVTKYIDKKKLSDIMGADQLAQASQEAFAAELAGASGGKVSLDQIKAQLGLGKGTTTAVGANIPMGATNNITVTVAPGAVVVSGGKDATGLGELIGQKIKDALLTIVSAEQRTPTGAAPGLAGNP
jgi:hypothetical protein